MSEQSGKTVVAENVSIRYKVGDLRCIGLKEYLLKRILGRYEVRDFWANREVSFTLREGDLLGIIGTNGAGKSTLLKAISGIMKPTEGRVWCRGRVAALLELSSGFDPELTVRENTYLRGALLGYTRAFMDETYREILSFSDLGEYEDRKFMQLSSGMKSRLAFAIASLVRPEILILDEVFAVGDGAFRARSEAKMREIISSGATTILVSHAVGQIRAMCNKVLWLHKGRPVVFTDDVEGACDSYEEFLKNAGEPVYDPVAARARIEARQAEKVRKQAEYDRMMADAAKLPAVEAKLKDADARLRAADARLEKYGGHLARIKEILKG